MSEEELYRAASGSERVRLKIVGDYLASLKTPGAPLVRGGGGTLAAPPRKARSIDEAGNMALLYFKKGEQAQARSARPKTGARDGEKSFHKEKKVW